MEIVFAMLVGLLLGGGAVWAVIRARVDAARAESLHSRELLEQVKRDIPNAMKAASNDASQSLMQLANQELGSREKAVEQMVKPIAESLQKVGLKIEELDRARAGTEGKLTTQL